MSTLLNCPFHEISESNHKNLISKNFTKSLSPQNQASHVLFSLYSHLPDCVIEKGLLSKGISLLKLSHQFVAFVDGSRAFFYDIKGWSGVSFIYNDLSLHILLGYQSSSNCIFVVIRETAKKSYILHKFFILLVLLDDNLFNSLSKCITINSPERAVLTSLNWKSPWRFIKQSDLPESVSYPKSFLDLIIRNNLHHSLLNDEETHSFWFFSKDVGIWADTAVKHLLGYILNFCLTKVVEDKVIFETAQQKSHLLIFFLFFLRLELLFELHIVHIILPLTVLSHLTTTY